MKQSILVLVLLFLFVPRAWGFEIEVRAGQAGPGMDEVNDKIRLTDWFLAFVDRWPGLYGWHAETKKIEKSSAFSGNLMSSEKERKRFGVGLELMSCPAGSYFGTGSILGQQFTYGKEFSFSFTGINLLWGYVLRHQKLSFEPGFSIGLLLGSLSEKTKVDMPSITFMGITSPAAKYERETPYGGSCLNLEASGNLSHNLTQTVSLTIATGYRLASISQMKAKENVDLDGDGSVDIKAGDAWSVWKITEEGTAVKGEAIKVDVSGYKIMAGLRIAF